MQVFEDLLDLLEYLPFMLSPKKTKFRKYHRGNKRGFVFL
jgi:hypothetical protein